MKKLFIALLLLTHFGLSADKYFVKFLEDYKHEGSISVRLSKSVTLRKAVPLEDNTKCVTRNLKTLKATCALVPFSFEGEDLSELEAGSKIKINPLNVVGPTLFQPLSTMGEDQPLKELVKISRGPWVRRFVIESPIGFPKSMTQEKLARINKSEPLFLSIGDVAIEVVTKKIKNKKKRGLAINRSLKNLSPAHKKLRICFNQIRSRTRWEGSAPLLGLKKMEDFMAKHLHQSVAQYHKHCKKKYKFSKCPGDKRNKKPLISNKDVAVLVEYSKSFPSSRRRFFVLDLKKCQTTFKEFAVHGGKSSYKSPDHGSCRRSKKDKVVAKPIEIARKKVQTVKASTSNYGGLFGFLSGGASSSIDTEKEDFSYKKKYRRRSKYNGKLCSCKNPKGSRTDMTRPQFAVTRQLYKSTSSYSKSWGTIAYKKKSPMDGIMLNSLGEPYNGQYIDLIKPGVVLHEHKLIPNRKKLQAVGQGCPSVPRGRLRAILKRYGNRFASGTLIYMHAPQCQ